MTLYRFSKDFDDYVKGHMVTMLWSVLVKLLEIFGHILEIFSIKLFLKIQNFALGTWQQVNYIIFFFLLEK